MVSVVHSSCAHSRTIGTVIPPFLRRLRPGTASGVLRLIEVGPPAAVPGTVTPRAGQRQAGAESRLENAAATMIPGLYPVRTSPQHRQSDACVHSSAMATHTGDALATRLAEDAAERFLRYVRID